MSFSFDIQYDGEQWTINCATDHVTINDLVKDGILQFMTLSYEVGYLDKIERGQRIPVIEEHKHKLKSLVKQDPRFKDSFHEEMELGLHNDQFKVIMKQQIKTGMINVNRPSDQPGRSTDKIML